MISSKIPRQLQKSIDRNEHKIDLYYTEPDEIKGGWCVWIHLNPEWRCPVMECGTIVERNANEAAKKLNNAVLT